MAMANSKLYPHFGFKTYLHANFVVVCCRRSMLHDSIERVKFIFCVELYAMQAMSRITGHFTKQQPKAGLKASL